MVGDGGDGGTERRRRRDDKRMHGMGKDRVNKDRVRYVLATRLTCDIGGDKVACTTLVHEDDRCTRVATDLAWPGRGMRHDRNSVPGKKGQSGSRVKAAPGHADKYPQ